MLFKTINDVGCQYLRTCPQGHHFYRNSDCYSCPACEKNGKPKSEFLAELSATARRALENIGMQTVQQLSEFSEEEVLKFHGLGKSSWSILKAALATEGLTFKKLQ